MTDDPYYIKTFVSVLASGMIVCFIMFLGRC